MEKHEEVMGIKNYKMVHLALGIVVFMSSCSQKEMDPHKLSKEFYQLNKGKDLDGLFDVSIGSGRVTSVYDESLNQYDLIFNTIAVFDTTSKNYVTLPVFKREASLTEKDSVFRRIKPEVKDFMIHKLAVTSEAGLFDSYVEYVGMVYEKYYNIATPKFFGYKNIVLGGNPRIGKFITFELTEKVKVYYMADPNSLTEYWTKHFSKLNKLDDNWFYEIAEDKKSSE